ncbi:MAG: hypothetical protein KGS61_17820, partial [Verrucomicrobia bacterium]|nr:hypothetical protein [Verrucomicrobiota bacterium]
MIEEEAKMNDGADMRREARLAGNFLLIANPAAGRGRAGERLPALLEALRQSGARAEGRVTRRPGDAVELARNAAAAYDCVAAVGGDGTTNEVASGLLLAAEPRAALGIVPFGTGNDAAQLLGIRSSATALAVLTRGRVRRLDAIEVRCQSDDGAVTRYGLLFAAAGFADELLRQTSPPVKHWFGPRYCYSV